MRIDASRPRSVVGWTVLAGVAAGLLAAVYFSVAGEPAIEDAIAIEEAAAHAEGTDHGDAPVSRSTQRGAGLYGAYAITGGIFGLLLAVVALSLRGEWLDPFRRYLVAGTVLATTVTVAPWLKYPPNPPAVGDPGTVDQRQLAHWSLILLTGLLLAGATHLSGRLRRAGWPAPQRVTAVAAAVTVALGLVMVLMPAGTVTIPETVPASLVWRFRTASLLGNLLLWGLVTLGAGTAYSMASARGSGPQDQNSIPFRADTPLS